MLTSERPPHREGLPFGTRSSYARGCRCASCHAAAYLAKPHKGAAAQRAAEIQSWLDKQRAGTTAAAPAPKPQRGRPTKPVARVAAKHYRTDGGMKPPGFCQTPGAGHIHCVRCGCPMNAPPRPWCTRCVEDGVGEELPSIDDLATSCSGDGHAAPEVL